MTVGTYLYTLCFGKAVGKDTFGNTYYTSKRTDDSSKPKRWEIGRAHV